ELWKSDGTETGTRPVRDIGPGTVSGYPRSLIDVNGTLYFVADDGDHVRGLWKSDGTETGTVLLKDINEGHPYPSDPGSFTNVNGTLYFTLNGQLWKSDGTKSGTVTVGRPFVSLSSLTNVNGTLFFNAYFTDDQGYGHCCALWKSDGTEAGTVLIKD